MFCNYDTCSYKNRALLAKFQPAVLNTFVLICGCLLYFVRVPSYFEALWYPHLYLDRKSNV